MGERTRELLILVCGDAAIFVASLWLTLLIRYLEWPSADLVDAHIRPFALLTALWLVMFFAAGLYDKHTLFLRTSLLKRIIKIQVANIFLAAALFFVIPFGIAPKTNLVIYLCISILLISFWRARLFNAFSPKSRHKAILIADGVEATELADEVNNNERYNYSFYRLIDEKAALHMPDFETKLLELIKREQIEIVVANPHGDQTGRLLPTLFDLAFLEFQFTFLDFYRVYEDTFDRIPIRSVQYDWFITNVSQSRKLVYDVFKRIFDIVLALVLLVPTAILVPFVYAAIKLQDGGPLLYHTERIGQFNRPFHLMKFRSMSGMDQGTQALKTNHVVTRTGAVLRKTRIDELPQLINVLRGDMSFFGPRPEMPALVKAYAEAIPYYNARHFIKPGISGWAQINNLDVPRGGLDVERTITKLSYDLFYLKNRSVWLDMQIFIKTINTVLSRTGT